MVYSIGRGARRREVSETRREVGGRTRGRDEISEVEKTSEARLEEETCLAPLRRLLCTEYSETQYDDQ